MTTKKIRMMKTGTELKDAFHNLWNETVNILPTILIGLLILIGGWILAKLLSKLVLKLLNRTKDSKLSKQLSLDSFREKYGVDLNLSVIISKLVYWVIFLFFIVAASETFGFNNVSREISILIHFIPRLLSGLLIFVIGYAIARFVRDAIKSFSKTMEVGVGNILGEIIFYFLILIVSLTTVAQAGVNIEVISTHMYIIVGAVAITITFSIGLGAKEIVSDLLKNYYNRGVIAVGDTLIYENKKGVVEQVTKTSVVYAVDGITFVIPAKDLYSSVYSIIKKQR